eukprot:gene5844-9667_t
MRYKSKIAGYDLYKHYKALAQHKGSYLPPQFYDAMKAVPPPKITQKQANPGKIVFPDDKLRRKIETKTTSGQELSRFGIGPTPWWFTNRPVDEAVKRIKEIMKTKKISESEALKEWDDEHERIQRINKREIDMLNQDAEKEGKCLTALDAFKMIKKMRKLQLESQTFREFRLKTAADEDGEEKLNILRKLREPEMPSLIPQHLLNDSLKRKLVQVLELREIVSKILHIKRVFNPENSEMFDFEDEEGVVEKEEEKEEEKEKLNLLDFKNEEEEEENEIEKLRQIDDPSDIDFIDAFVNAFEVDKVSPTSPEWGKSRFEGNEKDDIATKIEESLSLHYRAFKISYERFCKLVFVEIDIGKYLSSINLNLDSNSFSQTNLYKFTKQNFFDISPLISRHENSSRFEILKNENENLKSLLILNELLYLVEKDGFLKNEKIEWKRFKI